MIQKLVLCKSCSYYYEDRFPPLNLIKHPLNYHGLCILILNIPRQSQKLKNLQKVVMENDILENQVLLVKVVLIMKTVLLNIPNHPKFCQDDPLSFQTQT